MDRKQMRFDVSFAFSARWAAGCKMSFQRQVIEDLGGFDENFGGAPGEDAEFSHRVRKAGLIQYAPGVHLIHLKAPSGGDRDAVGQACYVWQTAFCVNYFWFKVEAPWRLRRRMAPAHVSATRRKPTDTQEWPLVLICSGFLSEHQGQ